MDSDVHAERKIEDVLAVTRSSYRRCAAQSCGSRAAPRQMENHVASDLIGSVDLLGPMPNDRKPPSTTSRQAGGSNDSAHGSGAGRKTSYMAECGRSTCCCAQA